jgi:hypothetical protein
MDTEGLQDGVLLALVQFVVPLLGPRPAQVAARSVDGFGLNGEAGEGNDAIRRPGESGRA